MSDAQAQPISVEDVSLPASASSVRKLASDGKHNAFTALTRWKDSYWLAYRSGVSHSEGPADIVILRSANAETWSESFRIDVAFDDRDPHFVATTARLFIYFASREKTPPSEPNQWMISGLYTDDGKTLSERHTIYERRFVLWQPLEHKGRFYSAAYWTGENRYVDLVTSDDGLDWRKISTIVGPPGVWSETTLHMGDDGVLTAFARKNYKHGQAEPGTARILESRPPYREWKTRTDLPFRLEGHSVSTFRGVTYLFTRCFNAKVQARWLMIYTYENGELRPYCRIPTYQDCTYAEAVEIGEEMLVSFYSTDAGTTHIYLARVPLKTNRSAQ